MITASDELWRGFLQPHRWHGACYCCPPSSFLGVLVLEKESLDWQRLEGKRLGEKLGVPTVLFMGDGKEIVALDRGAYPEKFGRWRDFLNRITAGSFGIQAESYSVDWLG
jgi:hypothetical protein